MNPFKKNGKVKILRAGWRALIGKKTIGESKHLLNYMRDSLSSAEYEKIKKNNIRYTVAITNMKNGTLSYKCSDNYDRSDMINWMWASANEPLFMSYYPKGNKHGGDAYVDGGVISNVPVMEALDYATKHDIDAIDVIVNKPKAALGDDTLFTKRDVFNGLMRLLTLFTVQIRDNNIEMAFLQNRLSVCQTGNGGSTVSNPELNISDIVLHPKKYVKINVYYFPPEYYNGINSLNQKELVFNKKRMKELWYAGENGKKDVVKEVMYFDKTSVNDIYNKYLIENKNIHVE